jgi:hypothetical protein
LAPDSVNARVRASGLQMAKVTAAKFRPEPA